MAIGFDGLRIQWFDGLRRVNLACSKPKYQIVPNLQTLISRYMDHRGYRGYIDTMVCYISFQYPALLAGRRRYISNLISNKPSYGEYAGYMGHGGLMV